MSRERKFSGREREMMVCLANREEPIVCNKELVVKNFAEHVMGCFFSYAAVLDFKVCPLSNCSQGIPCY